MTATSGSPFTSAPQCPSPPRETLTRVSSSLLGDLRQVPPPQPQLSLLTVISEDQVPDTTPCFHPTLSFGHPHLSLCAAVLLHPFNEIRSSLQVLLKLSQGHVPFLRQDMRHVGLCREEVGSRHLSECVWGMPGALAQGQGTPSGQQGTEALAAQSSVGPWTGPLGGRQECLWPRPTHCPLWASAYPSVKWEQVWVL